jgi:C-terminal processing protease CtpA/Prc/Tol biopolymer transport system component
MRRFGFIALLCLLCVSWLSAERETVKLGSLPVLSPDGKRLVFEFRGDLWRASSNGGKAERLTAHPAQDTRPVFSPDGKRLAFSSKRDNTWQTYVIPSGGGYPEQLTFHSEGSFPYAWYPDGQSLIVRGSRASTGFLQERLFKISLAGGRAEELLFNGYAYEISLSPDGKRLLFSTRGSRLYRRGYSGSLASRIWLRDLDTGEQTLLCDDPQGSRSPMWKPDGSGFYYARQSDGCFNIWEFSIVDGRQTQVTKFTDGSVIIPSVARNGRVMVFRQLFDFYRMDPTKPKSLKKLELWVQPDTPPQKIRRRWYEKAWNNDGHGSFTCTDDGLELCFTAGGDLWVMDTVLREPRLICGETATHDREPFFAPDGKSIFFLRDDGLGVNIWKAEKSDPDAYWWQNEEFVLSSVTTGPVTRCNLTMSPDGERLAVVENGYKLQSFQPDGAHSRTVMTSPFKIYYEWSPDSRWMACSVKDSWGNSDVWIADDTKEKEPFNISRHPNWDGNARWSPNGKVVAFVGRRYDKQTDIYYAWLSREDEVRNARTRRIEEAIKAMESERGKQDGEKPAGDKLPDEEQAEEKQPADTPEAVETPEDEPEAKADPELPAPKKAEPKRPDPVSIDFDGLSERVHQIRVGGTPSGLFWSYDSKALVFQSTINEKRGTYKVGFPNPLKPEFMTKDTGSYARWIEKGSKIMWLNDGVPAAFTQKYPFKVFQETSITDYRRLAFRLIWRRLRDRFYDPKMNSRDWEATRLKYEDAAASCSSWECFERVAEMLMGELNASHMAFEETTDTRKEWNPEYSARQGWHKRTAALGLRFDEAFEGPGLKVSYTVENSAADRAEQPVRPGEILLAIDGTQVAPGIDLSTVVNGRYPRSITLRVQGPDGTERNVEVEEESFKDLRKLVRREWMESNRGMVEQLSKGRLGYLDIKAMDFAGLRQFEKEVYARGFGKSGLVIDVRNNNGGFISDYLLGILCHPGHAMTIPRNGEECYQQGYLPSAAWFKPIIVLCNEFSASNAEIFSHAIRTLGRGRIVGVPTQGSVISTSTEKILDVGTMRVPHRGWFTLPDGRDMEYKPCVPDYVVRTEPGAISEGRDEQLEKAVEVLIEEIESGTAVRTPEPVYAVELRKEEQKK